MKIQVLSDLHLEVLSNRARKLSHSENEMATVLILAGDICELNYTDLLTAFLADVASRFYQVIYVPGNHEYYHGALSDDVLGKKICDAWDNVHYLNCDTVTIDGINFIGATLWTNMAGCNADYLNLISYNLNDYRLIALNDNMRNKAITANDTINLFHEAHSFFSAKMLEYAGHRNIIVSHHAPSRQSIHANYFNNPINPAFYSDIEADVLKWQPILWIHGHMHNSFDYMIGDTRVICNPRGYPNSQNDQAVGCGPFENYDFYENLTVDIT